MGIAITVIIIETVDRYEIKISLELLVREHEPQKLTNKEETEMSKDPVRNVDRKKIRGGQFNEFDFARHHSELTREQEEESGQAGGIPVSSEQLKADRIKQLLAKYGASIPGEKKTVPEMNPAPARILDPTPMPQDDNRAEPETKSMIARPTPVLREVKKAEPETKPEKKPDKPTKPITTTKPAKMTRSIGKATNKAEVEKAKRKTTAKGKSSSTTRAKSSSATAKKAATKGRSTGARKSSRPSR